MFFSYNFLKKYLKLKESPYKLGEILTMHLAETEVFFENKRPILDIDLLPNRVPDCAGHFGILREISAILNEKFELPKVKVKETKNNYKIKDWVEVKIESPLCYRYEMRGIFWLKIKESPLWLKEFLRDCGLKSINNVVDATNYVMLLTGQPLHVFDFQKIAFNKEKKKEIIIRQARKGEELLTLDNKLYKLNSNHLLITDAEKALAIAGIKGGKLAEVDKKTVMILIESANFDSYSIRKTSQDLNLKTDASKRFEHNLDINLTDYALDYLTDLIQKLAGGEVLRGKIDVKNKKIIKKEIFVSFSDFEKFTKINIKKETIKKKLSLLGFNLKEVNQGIKVTPPLYRTDILVKEDVIGEVLRLIGFNNIKALPPKAEIICKKENEFLRLKNKLKEILKSFPLFETYNYSFISEKEKKLIEKEYQDKIIEILNPTSELFKYLRPTLTLNFLKNISDNFRFEDKVGFYEIGNIYFKEKESFKEETVFAGALASKEKDLNLFFEAKGIIEKVFKELNLKENEFSFKNLEGVKILLENGAKIALKDKEIGTIGIIKEEILKEYKIKGTVIFWEIKILPLLEYFIREKEFKPLPLYPPVKRDLSFIVKKRISYKEIIEVIRKASIKYLENIELFDIYTGNQLEKDEKSLSFHLTFRSKDKTLTSEEADKEIEKIINALKTFEVKIR